MTLARIRNVIDATFRTGEKNGKSWSIAKVELDNGKTTNIFNPIAVGDTVESFEKDGYTNWRLPKEKKPEHSQSASNSGSGIQEQGLRALYKLGMKHQKMLVALYKAVTDEDYPGSTNLPTPVVTRSVEPPVQSDALPPVDSYDPGEFLTEELPFGEDN